MNWKIITILLVIILSSFSCERKQQAVSETISVDGEELSVINASTIDTVELETEEIIIESGMFNHNQKVHIVGQDMSNALYWLNGVVTTLPKDGNKSAGAIAIAVSGSDVHIIGYEHKYSGSQYLRTDAVYWLNGVQTTLPSRFSAPVVAAIAVSDNNVYIVGRDGDDAVYWLNQERIRLPRKGLFGRLYALANGIAISGSDVYIAGCDSGDAVYWLNGIHTVLSRNGGHPGAKANGIAVSGSNVYIVGSDGINAVYWLNGDQTVLHTGGSAYAIAISDSDVYIAGYADGFVYWRNGIKSDPLPIESGADYVKIEAIAVLDSDVFIVGTDDHTAVLWLNGNRIALSNLYWASSIFVTH